MGVELLPAQYSWLKNEPAPRHMLEALKLFGELEVPGPKSNSSILEWAKELKSTAYSDDSIPWCGLFVAICMQRAGREPVKNFLWALNWAQFGVKIDIKDAMFGDVLVFARKGGGHVGFYVGESSKYFYVLGGNQSDKVCIVAIDKTRCAAVRRPEYKNKPENIRKITNINAPVSQNEQ